MVHAVLAVKSIVLSRHTMRKLNKAQLLNDIEKRKVNNFNTCVKPKLGDSITLPPQHIPNKHIVTDNGVREFNSVMNIDEPDFDSFTIYTDYFDSDNVETLRNQ